MLEHALLLLWLAEGPTALSAISSCVPPATTSHTSVPPSSEWITDFDTLALIPSNALRGRRLLAYGAHVGDVTRDGFWVDDVRTKCRVFVVPAEGALIRVSAGDVVDLQGEFRAWRDGRTRPRPVAFLYAYTVREAAARTERCP